MTLDHLRELLLDLLWPQACADCRDDLPKTSADASKMGAAAPLCRACFPRLRTLEPPFCAICGIPSSPGARAAACSSCRARKPLCRIIRAAYLYREAAVPLIHAFKYRGRKSVASWAGRLMAASLSRFPELRRADAVMAVPLHRRRLSERGYNQAEILARSFSDAAGIFYLGAGLSRARNTRPQWNLGRRERLANLADAFNARQEHVRDKSVLLIDDVCTTGASLDGCAEALLRAGAREVLGYAFAREI